MRAMLCIGLAAWVLCSVGCGERGPARASVSGTVQVDGRPFNGRIDFIPAEGRGPTSGAVIQDGAYRIDQAVGVAVEKNRVEIRGPRATGRKIVDPMRPSVLLEETEEAVPPEYNERSTLVRTVVPGHNEFNFDLPGAKSRGK